MALYKGYTTTALNGAIADGVLLGSTDDNLILTPNGNGTWHLGFSGTIYTNFVPYTNTITFGSASNRFNTIYAIDINTTGNLTTNNITASGTITGTSFTGLAAKATADADGNNIKTTYSKERYTTLQLNVADWSAYTFQGEACFKAQKTLTGATTDGSHAIVAPYTTNQATKDDELSAFSLIYDSYCENNVIIFYATEKPETAFKVQVKGW